METKWDMELGDILAELREDRGLTQLDLSKQLHISNSSISAYENGSRLPSIDIIVCLAKFFDVTTDYLFGLTKNSVSPNVLTQEFVDGESVGAIIEKLMALDPKQRSAIRLMIENARFYSDVKRKTTDEGNDQP